MCKKIFQNNSLNIDTNFILYHRIIR
ncbi:MAG: hypothetical protein ACI9OS_002364, partial [Ulvibacter sp.]